MSIDAIYLAGDDALANQFQVIIPPFQGIVDNVYTTLRITTIEIPDSAVGTYEINYGTQKMTKASGKIDTANEFSFTFRNDKQWNTYQGFKNWKDFVINEETGIAAEDIAPGGTSNYRVPITVFSVDSNGTPTGISRVMEGCFPSTVSGISFDVTSGEPLETTITMQFMKMREL